jgi:hypothetical protein
MFDYKLVIIRFFQGGKTLANKSKRFGDVSTENPGPGTYCVEKYTEFRNSKSAPLVLSNKDKAGSVSYFQQ